MAFAANHFGNTPWLIPGYRIEKSRIYTKKHRDSEVRSIPLHSVTNEYDMMMMIMMHRSLVCLSVLVGLNSGINFSLAHRLTYKLRDSKGKSTVSTICHFLV